MELPDIKLYRQEKKKWKEAGEPTRSDEKVLELFEICKSCEHFIKITKSIGQCGVCTCALRQDGDAMNKLRWATTSCPLPEPKWTAEEGIQKEAEQEVPAQPQYINRPKKGGCGCGK